MASRLILLCVGWLFTASSFSQADTIPSEPNTKKLKSFILLGGAGYATAIIGLNQLWYKHAENQSFTFFNDSRQWKQLDKVGHFYSAFHLSRATAKVLQGCEIQANKANLWGSVTGFFMLLPVEIFDGFSANYGASTTDLLANAGGAVFYYTQTVLWNEIRLHPKYSFQRTPYPALRTDDTLGNGVLSELVKDYNGQTYWLSVDVDKFIQFPKWLNVAIGYGADGMVYATDEQNLANGYTAKRQIYLGLDFDLSHIKTRSKALNTLLYVVNLVKLPAPALEFSGHTVSGRFFQF